MDWTIEKAATEFGVARETIRRGLAQAGVEVKRGRGNTFTTRQIFAALAGDLKIERTLKTRVERETLELEKRKLEGELVSLEEVTALVTPAFLPIRQRLNGLPAALASQCNPTDPLLARDALQRWVAETLPLIRETLPRLIV